MAGRGNSHRGDNGWGEWGGYMAAKKRKLEEQFDKDSSNNAKQLERKSNIFQGISIFVDGHTEPPADELKKLMMEHGGVYHAYYSKDKITYFISNNLPYAKIRKLKPNDKVINSKWITDCIKENKLLSTHNYEMYKDMTRSRGQTELNFKRAEPMKPITSDFNVPNSDDEDDHSSASETEEAPTEDDDHQSALDAKHPKFLETFLKRSRLHYLSSTAVAKKVYVQELRQKPEHRQLIEKRREELKNTIQRTERDYLFKIHDEKKEKIYMHIDMDCFFVSVATRHQPELRDQPIAITHSKGRKAATTSEHQFYSRSELASCNYAARQYGIKNGMYLGRAQELCRNHQAKLLCLPYDYEGFHEVSDRFYDTVLSYTLEVEAVSCDELYVDLTDLLIYLKPLHPLTFVALLREEIQINTKCPCSAGLGSNMLLARLATRQAKPNGQYYVEKGYEQEFIAKQKLIDLPGIGSSILDKLQQTFPQTTVDTCKQVQNLCSLEQLKNILGKKQGQTMYDMTHGIDTRILTKDYLPKSISIDINYGIRFQTFDDLTVFIKQLVLELHKRLKQARQKGKQLSVKIRVRAPDAPIEPEKFMGCGRTDDSSRLVNLHSYTDDPVNIELETIKLLKQMNFIVADLRGIGISMTQFQSALKNTSGKDMNGHRTLFDCNQFRVPKPSSTTVENQADTGEPSESSVTRKRPMQQEPTTTAVPQKVSRLDCYTPGQIDPHVMNELPEPIRQEVEQYLKNPPSVLRQNSESDRVEVVEKSFTQVMDHLDEAVLNELPPEMRREITMAQKLRKMESKYPPIGGKRLIPISVPLNPVIQEKSNAFNVLMNSPQKQPTTTTKKTSIPVKRWRTETILNEEPMTTTTTSNVRTESKPQSFQQQPSIAGFTSLSDVKLMLREWIESSDEPNQIDFDLFQNYLIDLLNSYNAEMVHQLLSYGLLQLKPLTSKSQWIKHFQSLIEAVQTRFRQMYGGATMDLS
ncbi:unnamed protein product [Adineta ricciae]|uniref:DNA repair protein REV1 n=1 Tax=Adineta ricciae TaxID=249248 RepID=A0A815X468_ADIRI|nr:unnamed protein product [Adineta ricciae]CAF1550711.1 unnamed protein product [Adineta ricciae]